MMLVIEWSDFVHLKIIYCHLTISIFQMKTALDFAALKLKKEIVCSFCRHLSSANAGNGFSSNSNFFIELLVCTKTTIPFQRSTQKENGNDPDPADL